MILALLMLMGIVQTPMPPPIPKIILGTETSMPMEVGQWYVCTFETGKAVSCYRTEAVK